MHVLHVIVGLDIGGAELMLSRLVDGNREAPELRHSVVSLTGLGTVGAALRREGVPVHTLDMKGASSAPVSLFRLSRLIRRLQPDVVQTWMYHADFLGGIAAVLAGHRRVIWGVRATHVQSEGLRVTIWLRRLCALLSRWLPEKIVCAAEASRQAHAEAGYDRSRMIVIPNGFDTATLKAAALGRSAQRERSGFTGTTVVIGAVGRFNAVKDFHNFVEASRLVAKASEHAQFVLVGRDLDEHNAELMGWISKAGLAPRFTLLGERSDVPACLSAMDIFCLSSRSEGFPNVVGEAMAVGVPCVVTDVGDAAMLVGDTGIVVPSENSPALAAGLVQMMNLPTQARQQYGEAAQRRIESNFSIEVSRQRFEQVYRQENTNIRGQD